MTENLTSVEATNPGSFLVEDRFDSKNQFNGGEIGLSLAMHRGPVSLELTPKIALGVNHENVGINGSTLTTDANGVNTLSQGGLLALSSNIGQYSQNTFAVVPELGATLGYQVTRRIQLTLGYSFLYWNRVCRAGDAIDYQVNPNLIPGGSGSAGGNLNHPVFTFNQSSFWGTRVEFWRHVSLVTPGKEMRVKQAER